MKTAVSMYTDTLRTMFNNSLQRIADKFLEKQLISVEVHNKPTFDAIISDFFTSMVFFQTINEIQGHCSKFLTVFKDLGGPFAKASTTLAKEWKTCAEEAGVILIL